MTRQTAIKLTFAVFAILALASSGMFAAQDSTRVAPFTGTWHVPSLRALIKVDVSGTTVTGSVAVERGAPISISRGEVSRNTITFRVENLGLENLDGKRTVTFRGTLSGTIIAFTRSVSTQGKPTRKTTGILGEDGPKEFIATRASGSISGRVLEKASGKPIGKAAVTLFRYSERETPAGPPKGEYEEIRRLILAADEESDHLAGYSTFATAEAALDGTFEFTDLPVGTYRLWVSANHYLLYENGQRVQGGRGARLTLQAGEHLDARDMPLTRKSAFTGTVVDERGAPMPNVEIRVYTRHIERPEDDKWKLIEVGTQSTSGDTGFITPFVSVTDASGRYRIEDLAPADYYVVAQPPMAYLGPGGFRGLGELLLQSIAQRGDRPASPVMALRRDGGSAGHTGTSPADLNQIPSGEIYLSTFYSDAINVGAARSVYVPPGGDIRGLDITVRRTQTAQVKGSIVTPPSASGVNPVEPSEIRVGLFVDGPGWNLRRQQEDALFVNAAGTFQFSGVVPGKYRLLAAGYQAGRRITAARDLEIQPGSAQTVTLTLQPGIDVPGRIQLHGPAPSGFQPSSVLMHFSPVDSFSRIISTPELQIRTAVNPDGSFLVPNIIPGARYTFSYNAPNGVVLSEWTYGGGPISPSWFGASNSEATLDLVFESGHTSVDVLARDQDKPQGDILVLLREQKTGRILLWNYTAADGKASFTSVLPGDYEVFAVEGMMPASWYEPHILEKLAGRGRPIHVQHGSALFEAVRVIYVDRD